MRYRDGRPLTTRRYDDVNEFAGALGLSVPAIALTVTGEFERHSARPPQLSRTEATVISVSLPNDDIGRDWYCRWPGSRKCKAASWPLGCGLEIMQACL